MDKNNKIKCINCHNPIETEDGEEQTHCVQILRGYFTFKRDNHGDIEEINCEREKASLFLCIPCYLSDPDLCKFFNKNGWQIR